jgi:multiple sugar transport system ATP-binding protein
MSSVQLRGLTRRFPGAPRAALDALDLEVRAGEVVSLVGPSGCGKSTTLRLVAGLDRPDGGDVLIDGKSVRDVPPQERDVAMVFQGFALYPHMRVRDILSFPLRMRRVAPAERERTVEETAALLGLTPLLDRRPGQLSGGEQQRVAMGRAIVRRPRVFLFDEPLSNLDAALRNELRVELARLLRDLGATALYVTHDQVEAMTLSHRIAVLCGGRLEQLGTPRAIYETPESTFVARFFGSPPMNLLEAVPDGSVLRAGPLVWPRAALTCEVPERPLRLGFRPEHVVLLPAGSREGAALDGARGAAVATLPVRAQETLGAETHLAVVCGDEVLRLRSPGFLQDVTGKNVEIAVPASALRLFDAESGRAC